eukprot:scaffold1847_cov343-Prasinococcus_capsulatus_cf.AAC.10
MSCYAEANAARCYSLRGARPVQPSVILPRRVTNQATLAHVPSHQQACMPYPGNAAAAASSSANYLYCSKETFLRLHLRTHFPHRPQGRGRQLVKAPMATCPPGPAHVQLKATPKPTPHSQAPAATPTLVPHVGS